MTEKIFTYDRSHEECCECTLEKVEPKACKGHHAGPVCCPDFWAKGKPHPSRVRTDRAIRNADEVLAYLKDTLKRSTVAAIVDCSNRIKVAEQVYFTCPKCSHYPVAEYLIPNQARWRECQKCQWNDCSSNVEPSHSPGPVNVTLTTKVSK